MLLTIERFYCKHFYILSIEVYLLFWVCISINIVQDIGSGIFLSLKYRSLLRGVIFLLKLDKGWGGFASQSGTNKKFWFKTSTVLYRWKSSASWAFYVPELGILNATMKSSSGDKLENDPKLMTWLDQNSSWSHIKYQLPSHKLLSSLGSFILYTTVEVLNEKIKLGPSRLVNKPPSFNLFSSCNLLK